MAKALGRQARGVAETTTRDDPLNRFGDKSRSSQLIRHIITNEMEILRNASTIAFFPAPTLGSEVAAKRYKSLAVAENLDVLTKSQVN